MSGDYWADCAEEVSRGGILQPCEKTAVALRMDPGYRQSYPVCAYHARGEMVPLAEIVRGADRTLGASEHPAHDCAETDCDGE